MKRILTVFLVVFCLFLSAPFAESVNGESGAYVNSWRPARQKLLFAQGKIYCLTAEKFLWNDYGVLIAVSKTSTERVLKKAGLKEIVPYQGNILLISREQTLDEALTNYPGGTSIWEVFDPLTGQTATMMRYHTDTSVESYFVGNDKVFYTTQYTMHEGANNALYRKDEPENVFLYSQTEKMGLEYPSYKTLCHGEKTYDPLTKSYHWLNIQVRIFDYVSETVLETDDTILPSEDANPFFQAVLEGRRMYYLSANGLNIWDFDNDTDTNVLPLDNERYTKFSLSENAAALFGKGWNVDFYDLSTGEQIKTVLLTVDPVEVYLTDQEMYVYDQYNSQMEYIHLETGEHAVFTIR